MSDANRIHLAGEYRKIQSDVALVANIYPGMVIAKNSAGKLIPHGVEGGPAERMVALEDALQGGVIGDLYAADNVVDAAIEIPGSVSQAMLAVDEVAAIGTILMSDGSGALKAHTGTNTPLAIAQEALDLSDSGDVATLVEVRWL